MTTNKVLVNNLCAWPLYFNRAEGQGSVEIPANAKNFPLLSYDEVLAQIQLGNRMFIGTDGLGGHARIQIVNEEQRKELFGVDDSTGNQTVLNTETVKELLAIRGKAKFNEKLNELVQTNAEKRMLVQLAFEAGAENAESWKVDTLRALADTMAI